MSISFEHLPLEGLMLVRSRCSHDDRGYFMETWSETSFMTAGINTTFVQANQSFSKRAGTVRGLHFQLPPYAQAKLVRVQQGVVFDVAVDLRFDSSTFGKWHGLVLRPGCQQLYIPRGFAHGFAALADDTVVSYQVDAPYAPNFESGIHWQDRTIAIEWPIDVTTAILSKRDLGLLTLAELTILYR